jgi:serine phosphatase RsbU (regulator of sigma subunit)
VLNRVLDVVQKIFSADAVSLMAYDPAKRTIDTSMARGVANREMLYLHVAPGDDIPGAVYTTRNPVMYGDLGSVDTPLALMAVAQGLRSLLAVPLLARGRSTGVLTVFDHSTNAFTEEDKELLLTFASQAALAIDTASLYGKEHHVASILQSSILPERLPAISGIEAASFYLPAGVVAEIGGDYYDLFTTRDGIAVLAIGDVCGKGVQAATKTSMIKYSLRGMVAAGATPGEALTELNRLLASSGDPGDIVTAWIGFIDPGRHSLTYADGGHPPALLRRPETGIFERLGPTGPLLGAIEGATYDEQIVELAIGDLLVTYTDGVTEARRGARFFGEGRIRRFMRRSASVEETVESLLQAVNAFSAGIMRDDAALLAVRVTEQS